MSERISTSPERHNSRQFSRLRRLAAQNVVSGGLMLGGLVLSGPVGWGIFGVGAAVEVKSWADFFRPSSSQYRRVSAA